MEKRKMTEVPRTPQYEKDIRKNQIKTHVSHCSTKVKAIEQFHDKGTLSHEIFAKRNDEKKYLKYLKRTANNERFAQIMQKNALSEKK